MDFFGACTLFGAAMLVRLSIVYEVHHLVLVSLGFGAGCAAILYGLRHLRWRWPSGVFAALIAAFLASLWGLAEYECMGAHAAPWTELPDGSVRDNDGTIRFLARAIGALIPIASASALMMTLAALAPRWQRPRAMRGR